MISVALIAVLPTTTGFIGTTYRLQKSTLSMCDYQTQVLAAQPTIEEWLDVADPDSIEFFETTKLDYVSCSPFRVPIARLAAARASLKNKTKSL